MLDMTIERLHDGYKKKEFSPVEVTQTYLEQIERMNDDCHAFITVAAEHALEQAAISERKMMARLELGALEGIPVSYKDIIETKDIRTTNGSKIDEYNVPENNAVVVKMLEQAGAITLGKANLYEYAAGIFPENPHYGNVKNPANAAWSAGGSSSGSAAGVAAKMCVGSIGTDTAGSIRVPSSCCNVVGLKPTYDVIPRKGVTPLSYSLDHVGPIARTTADTAAFLNALTPQDRNISIHPPCHLKGTKIGVPVSYLEAQLQEEVENQFYQAVYDLEAWGAVIVDIELPSMEEILHTVQTIVTSEMGCVHKTNRKNRWEDYGDAVKASLKRSETMSAHDYIQALEKKDHLTTHVSRVLNMVDVIAMPTIPVLPDKTAGQKVQLPKEEKNTADAYIQHTSLFNMTGHPAVNVPYRTDKFQHPLGIQLIAGRYREDLLLNKAYAIEHYGL
ncbi:amidase [Salibacterium sp. K-3]